MKNVTEYFENYREASRHLRNVYYVPEIQGDFDDELNTILFEHLVCARLGINHDQYNWFSVPAPIFVLRATGPQLPILINREPSVNHGYWDNEIDAVESDDLELVLISYFDWNPQGVMDNRYVMCLSLIHI